MLSPGGSPVTVYVSPRPEESVPRTVRLAVVPAGVTWVTGVATLTSATFHVRVMLPEVPVAPLPPPAPPPALKATLGLYVPLMADDAPPPPPLESAPNVHLSPPPPPPPV